MQKTLFGFMVLAAVGCNSKTTSSEMEASRSNDSLKAKIARVNCVKSVEDEVTAGIPEDPGSGGKRTGNLLILVKDNYTSNVCLPMIKAALPNLKVIASIAKVILVKGEAAPAQTSGMSLDQRIAKVSCVKYVEAERIIGTPENPVVGNDRTGNWLVGVKDEVSANTCVSMLKAAIPEIKISSVLQSVKIILISGK